MTSDHPFDVDTEVELFAADQYAATLSDRWNSLGGAVNGGYLLAVCLQALRRELPFPDPLVVSATYLRPGRPGPVRLATEIVRRGRSVATGEVRLVQEGREILRAVATFSDLDPDAVEGRTLLLGEMPVLPDPDKAIDPMPAGTVPGVTMADRIEFRMIDVPGWWRGEPSGQASTEFWMRFKEPRDADLWALPLLVDAAAPAVMDLGEAGSSSIEMTVHLRAHPAPGWLACRAMTRYVIGRYHEEDFEVWDSAGNLVAQSRQLAVLPRVARRRTT